MDIQYMKRAIELSTKGIGYVNPNPLVGAVIVKDKKIIGEGYHRFYGGHHAEIEAFNSATEDTKDATMYVTLEPCCHYGKTPPCVNAIIKNGIKKVVIGLKDPNPKVLGMGIEILRANGIEVVTGVLEDEVGKLNEIFIKYIKTNTPFCILKSAMTLDGKIAAVSGDSKWITDVKSRQYVHELRHRVSGIMVGIGTILADDPLLNTRLLNKKGSDAARIIVDSFARLPLESRVLNIESKAKTIVAVTEKASKERIEALQKKGAEIIITPQVENRVDIKFLTKMLGEMNIDSVLLEGGSELNFFALNEGIVDKVCFFIAPKIIGGREAKTPIGGSGIERLSDAINIKDIEIKRFENDIMIEGYINGR